MELHRCVLNRGLTGIHGIFFGGYDFECAIFRSDKNSNPRRSDPLPTLDQDVLLDEAF